MRTRKIKIKSVQAAFSHAIIRRDLVCKVRDLDCCYGRLECSHYFTQGSTPALMFYPFNAHAQCTKHHFNHHNKQSSKNVYSEYMNSKFPERLEYMESVKNHYIKYTDELKKKIIDLCNSDKLDELAVLIEEQLC